jgi:hypothetical protein
MAHRPLNPADLLGAASRIAGSPILGRGLAAWLADALLAERERWILWLPVGLGSGIALYFALASEPPVWLGATGLLIASVLLAWFWWRLPFDAFHGYAPGLLGLLVLVLGFTVATLRTQLVEAPALDRLGAYHGPARGRARPRATPSTWQARDGGARAGRHPGPDPGQHAQRGAAA